ncbi:MAG: hypothetical protein LLG01_00625 [Planctomycetaceae bacterium]|nr:hypothetical protein [Planctomycetaceae bacterium]
MGTNPNEEVIEVNVSELTEELLDQPETGIESEVAPEEPAPVEDEQPAEDLEPVDEAEEAIEEAEPTDEEPAPEQAAKPKAAKTVPLATHIKTERENRKLRRQLAEFRTLQQLEQPAAPQKPAEAAPSPFEKWEADNAEALREDPSLPVPAKIMREQREWDRQQQVQATASTTAEQEAHTRRVSIAQTKAKYSAEDFGDVLSFDTIVSQGASLLTQDDIRDINAVPGRVGEKSYRLCLERLRQSDPDVAREINAALRARRQSRTANPANPSTKTATPTRKANPPTREEVLRRGQGRPLRAHEALGLRFSP